MREAAAAALGKMGDKRAVEPLSEALKDVDAGVRRAAADALGELNEPYSEEPLIGALIDHDGNVRLAAAEALEKFEHPDWKRIIQGNEEDFTRIGESENPKAFELLVQALDGGDKNVEIAAAKALGMRKDRRAAGPMIKMLKSCDSKKCFAAAEALGELGDAGAVEPLSAYFIIKYRDT
jgi:HEAT repeat protein